MGSPLMAFAMEGLKIALLLLLAMVTNARVNYSGYQVFRVQVENMEQAELMEGLNREGKFDFWTEVRLGRPVDVMTSPENRKELETWLGEVDIHWSIMVEDVGVLMEAELVESKRVPGSKHNMDWTSYHALEDIYGWFEYLEETYDFAQTESIGQSYEGQDMIVMKVCKGECGNKPAMWIDSGIHAREWISPAVGTWMLSELVENDSAHPELTENLDWYFLPSHNPDGYRKSRNDDRMWRKTTTHYSGDHAREQMLTGTGTTTGQRLGLLMTAARRPTMAQKPSLRWKPGMSETLSCQRSLTSNSTRPCTVTASLS